MLLAQAVGAGSRVVFGVNHFVESVDMAVQVPLHQHTEDHEGEQALALLRLRAERDQARVARALAELRAAALGETNLVPVLVDTVKTYATIGEIFGVLREVFGEYRAPQVF